MTKWLPYLLLCFGHLSHASEPMLLTENEVFQKTYTMCAQAEYLEVLDLALESGKDLVLEVRIAKPSHYLMAMVRNPGFLRALEKCYGKDQTNQHLFLASLVAADLAGKAGGTAAVLGVLKVLKSAITWLQLSRPAVGIILHKANHLLRISFALAIGYQASDIYLEAKHEWKQKLERNLILADVTKQVEEGILTKEQAGPLYFESAIQKLNQDIVQVEQEVLSELYHQRDLSLDSYYNSLSDTERENAEKKILRLESKIEMVANQSYSW